MVQEFQIAFFLCILSVSYVVTSNWWLLQVYFFLSLSLRCFKINLPIITISSTAVLLLMCQVVRENLQNIKDGIHLLLERIKKKILDCFFPIN